MNGALVIIALTAVMALGLGLAARRGLRMTLEQWTVAGRGFGGLLVFLLTAGEIYTTFTFLGGSGYAYGRGAPAYYILAYGSLAYILSYWLLPPIWRYAKQERLVSQSHFFAKKYDSPGLGILVAIVGVVALVPYLDLQFKGLGIIVSLASYGSISSTAAIWIGAATVTIYVIISGVHGVAWNAAVKDILEAEGVHIRLRAECISFGRRGADIAIMVDCESGDREVIGSHTLLAVGRRPNTDDLGLDKAGVEIDKRGFIVVDDELRASAPGIWALGDCNGKGAFTHTAYNDFEVVAANLLDDDRRRVSDRLPAYALYVDPPLGRAGLTEAEARKSGRRILIGRRPMSEVARAVEKGETQGFIKIVVDADSHQILGASVLGVGGDEVVHCILDIMYAKAPYTTLRRAMHIHPTVSEHVPAVLSELNLAL